MAAPLVQVIAEIPDLAKDLVRTHAADARGYCPSCTTGAQSGRAVHPCRLYDLATAALQEIAKRRAIVPPAVALAERPQ